jgi:hypothetical protein
MLSDVGEVEVQRDKDSIFIQASIEDLRVWTTGQALVVDAVGVVARGVQQCLCIAWKILVKLETRGHPLRLRSRDWDHAFASQIRGVGNSRGNVFGF